MPSRRMELDSQPVYSFALDDSTGARLAYFKGVDGINSEIEIIEFPDGDDLFLRKRPRRSTPHTVTLKRVIFESDALTAWWLALQIPHVNDRRDLSIILNDNAGNEIRRWNLFGCVLSTWSEGNTHPIDPNMLWALTLTVDDLQIA
jgi:phage tail-like protein